MSEINHYMTDGDIEFTGADYVNPFMHGICFQPKKRKITDNEILLDADARCRPAQTDQAGSDRRDHCGRSFLHLKAANASIYHTGEVHSFDTGDVLYLPLIRDLSINLSRVDEITFDERVFFIADENGRYHRSSHGNAIHLWRFMESDQKMHIYRSFVFLNEMVFSIARRQIEMM